MTAEEARKLPKGSLLFWNRLDNWGLLYKGRTDRLIVIDDSLAENICNIYSCDILRPGFNFEDVTADFAAPASGDFAIPPDFRGHFPLNVDSQSANEVRNLRTDEEEPPCCGNYNHHAPDCRYAAWNKKRLEKKGLYR
jgi:hypothetical protein